MDGKKTKLLAVLAVALMAFTALAVITDSSDDEADEVVYEAEIGESKFTSLADAITNANSNDTINLLKNIESNTQYEINKAITLDGKNYTITSSAVGNAAILISSTGVTVKDLKVVGPNTTASGWNQGEYGIKVYGANLTSVILDNVTVSGANAGILINGNVTIKNTITVTGNEYGGIEVSKGTLDGAIGMLTFDNGASVVCADADVPAIWVDKYNQHYQNTLANAISGQPSTMKVLITDLTEDQCFIVTDSYSTTSYEAKIGSIYYEKLADAIASAASGNEVILLKDIVSATQYEINKVMTLNGNNKKITSSAVGNAAILISSAGVTVKGLKVVGPNTTASGWNQGEYGIKVYGANLTSVVLENVMVSGANAGILINGNVTIRGTITVTGNEYGGIEVSKGTLSGAVGKLTFDTGASVVCSDTLVPAIWVDKYSSDYGSTLANAISGQPSTMKVLITDSTKDQCFIVTNSYSLASYETTVGAIYYEKFEDAVKKATSNQTITLLKKCSYTKSNSALTDATGVTIDGKGKTLEVQAQNINLMSGTVLKSITFDVMGAGKLFSLSSGQKDITIDECMFSGDSSDAGLYFIYASGYKGKLTVDTCIFINSGDKLIRDIEVAFDSTASTESKVTVKDCTMTEIGGDEDSPVKISGKTAASYYDLSGNELMGGVALVTAYGSSSITLVPEADCEAQIGNLYYKSVADAFTDVGAANAITILKNCSITNDTTLRANAALDIHTGKTLTIDGSLRTITLTLDRGAVVNGTIAYKESATVSNSATFSKISAGTDKILLSKGSLKIIGDIVLEEDSSIVANGSLTMKNVDLSKSGSTGALTISKATGGSIVLDGIKVPADTTLNLSSNASVEAGSVLDVTGKVRIASGVILTNTGSILGTGTIENSGTISGTGTVSPNLVVVTVYTIKVENNGNGTASADKTSAKAGDVITLTATPAEGFSFKKWESADGISVTDGKFTMPTKNVTVKAIFEKKYSVTVNKVGKGTVTVSPQTAFGGDTVTVSYTTEYGSYFKSWKTDDTGTVIGTNGTFKMPQKDVTVTVEFGTYQDVTKTVTNGSVTIPWELAKKRGIEDQSKLTLIINKLNKAKQPNIPSEATAYEISLAYNGESLTTFSDKITVKLNYELPAGAKVDDYHVYYVSDDGKTVEDMDFEYFNGVFSIQTDHLSTYAVSPKVIQPVGDMNWTMIIAIIVAAVIILAAIFIFLKRDQLFGGRGEDFEQF